MVHVDWFSQSRPFGVTKSTWEIKHRKTKMWTCRFVYWGLLVIGLRFFRHQIPLFDHNNNLRRFGKATPSYSKGALPVYGVHRLMSISVTSVSTATDSSADKPVEVVTAANPSPSARGIVLLLHACTHNALKFFSSSPECPDCVGLSEELRITRLVQQRGYIPIAVTAADTRSGCWSNNDLPRLKLVIQTVQSEFKRLDTRRDLQLPVFAIGASSGGYMAAKVAAAGLADAALVMVMGLRQGLQQQLLQFKPPLYLAPMPRDEATWNKNRDNYKALVTAGYTSSQRNDHSSTNTNRVRITLDETSCVSLPVTEDYLIERVPGMEKEDAIRIVMALQEEGHLGKENAMFIRDPTVSDWRNVLLAMDPDAGSESVLWGRFPLARGRSPLAKAFHRAWAFHEYCSEAVIPAFEFFESFLPNGDTRTLYSQ